MLANRQSKCFSQEQHIYESLRDQIFQLEVEAGHLISLPEIAARYHVNLSKARDVCLRLQTEGILERTNDRLPECYQIVQFNDVYIDQIFKVRHVLEISAIRSCTEIFPSEIEPLRKIWEKQRTACEVKRISLNSYLPLDNAFHRELGGWSRNPFLSAAINQIMWLSTLIQRWFSSHHPTLLTTFDFGAISDEHLQILDALAVSDVETAAALLNQHISQENEALLTALRNRSELKARS